MIITTKKKILLMLILGIVVLASYCLSQSNIRNPIPNNSTDDRTTTASITKSSPTGESSSSSKKVYMIVKDQSNKELFRIFTDDRKIKIPGIQPNIYLDSGIKLSPNKSKFLYINFKSKENSGDATYDLWISSVDGASQSVLVPDLVGGFYFDWLDQENIIIWYTTSGAFSCPGKISVINIMTKNTTIIPQVPGSQRTSCYPFPLFNGDFTKSIVKGEKDWLSIDYVQKKIEHFQFDYQLLNTSTPWISYTSNDNSFSIVIPDLDRIYFGKNLSFQNSDHKLSTMTLPNNTYISDNNLLLWDSGRMSVAFDLIENTTGVRSLVSVGLSDTEMTNYSVDRASYNGNLGIPSYSVYSSSDGRFLGWTVYIPPENYIPFGAVVLDLQTGVVKYYDGYEILGFGEDASDR